LAVTDWRLRRWRLWFSALMTATRTEIEDTNRCVRNRETDISLDEENLLYRHV